MQVIEPWADMAAYCGRPETVTVVLDWADRDARVTGRLLELHHDGTVRVDVAGELVWYWPALALLVDEEAAPRGGVAP